MIKYFKELENREEYYLALVNVEDNGRKEVYNTTESVISYKAV